MCAVHVCHACAMRAPCVARAHGKRTPESQEAELRLVPVQRPHVDPHATRCEQVPCDAHRPRRVGEGVDEIARDQCVPRLRCASAVALGTVELLKGTHLQSEVTATVRYGGRDVGRAGGSEARRAPQCSRLAAHAREEAQGVSCHGAREQGVRRDHHTRGGVVGLDAVAAPRHLRVQGGGALWGVHCGVHCGMQCGMDAL